MNTDTIDNGDISPAPIDHLEPWISAAYGRASGLTGKFRNLVFTPEGEGRVAQIAGWLVGLCHAGKREEAEKIAADINSQFDYLNEYGGDMTDAAFGDGSPILKVPRFMVRIGDDGTFGGFTVAWYRAIREGSEQDGDRRAFLRNRWDSLVDHPRWGQNSTGEREVVRFMYAYSMNGGLLYHGPGGGETFSVLVGSPRFWSIHT